MPCPPPGHLPSPGIKPRSPALQADSLHLRHQGSSRILKRVAYPFSRGSSQPRNRSEASTADSSTAEHQTESIAHAVCSTGSGLHDKADFVCSYLGNHLAGRLFAGRAERGAGEAREKNLLIRQYLQAKGNLFFFFNFLFFF